MRISISTKWLIITVVVLLQLLLTVQGQVVDPTVSVDPKPTVSPKPITTTTIPPVPSVSDPPPSKSLSTLKPSVPPSSSAPPSLIVPPPASATVPPVVQPTSSEQLSSTSSTTTSSSTTNSATATPTEGVKDEKSDTPLIVGCVVGGVVGIALIGGVLACVNRRGGCTKKRDNKKSDFEDYGLGDFPHHRTPVIAAPVLPSKPISPTLPRLNDQGNYYNEDPNYGHYGYQDNNMDYGMQPQQGYYYAQQQQQPQHQQQQEYYDDSGYYYDSNTSATAYSSVAPMQPQHQSQHQPQLQQSYMMNNAPTQHSMTSQDVYKPDEVGSPVRTNNNVVHSR